MLLPSPAATDQQIEGTCSPSHALSNPSATVCDLRAGPTVFRLDTLWVLAATGWVCVPAVLDPVYHNSEPVGRKAGQLGGIHGSNMRCLHWLGFSRKAAHVCLPLHLTVMPSNSVQLSQASPAALGWASIRTWLRCLASNLGPCCCTGT